MSRLGGKNTPEKCHYIFSCLGPKPYCKILRSKFMLLTNMIAQFLEFLLVLDPRGNPPIVLGFLGYIKVRPLL